MTRRRVVLDTSVVVAAHFEERHSARAEDLVDAIDRQAVTAFAPHLVIVEFLKACFEKSRSRSKSQWIDRERVNQQVENFFDLQIVFVRESDLQKLAWEIMNSENISPPDSWMLVLTQGPRN